MENQKMFQHKLHHCEVSDSFVHLNMKLSNGKNGNGESRLFVSCSKNICKIIKKEKKIKIQYDDNYIYNLEPYVSDETNFRKKDFNRVITWKKNINQKIKQEK